MKKLLIFSGLALSLCAGFGTTASAQVRINVSLGAPVAQQPWYGYDDDYYYMPEQDVYYNVARRVYVYPEGGSWMYAGHLPDRYHGYSWNSGQYYRIHSRAPFDRNNYYRQQYAQGYDRREYRGDGGNPHEWGRQDNGRHNGWKQYDRQNNNGYNNNSSNNGYRGNNGYNNGGQYNGGGYHGRR